MAVLAAAAWDAMPRGFLRSTRPFSILPRRSKRERVVAGYHCRVCYHALGDLIIWHGVCCGACQVELAMNGQQYARPQNGNPLTFELYRQFDVIVCVARTLALARLHQLRLRPSSSDEAHGAV